MKKIVLIIILLGSLTSNAQEVLLVSYKIEYETKKSTEYFDLLSYFKITKDSLIYIRINAKENGEDIDITRYKIVDYLILNSKVFYTLEGLEFKNKDSSELILNKLNLVYDDRLRTMVAITKTGDILTYKIE